jgi:putative ABC transport system permease protein
MKRQDLLELAARNLRESVLRNSLTTAGVAVGVASLVATLSLGAGLQLMAGNRVQASGLFDTVVVYSRRDIRGFDRQQARATSTEDSRPLNEAARREIAQLPGVAEVNPEVRFQVEVRHGGRSYFATVAGLPPSSKANDAFEQMKGTYFSGPAAEEAILHLDFARELLGLPESGGAAGKAAAEKAGPGQAADATPKAAPATLIGQDLVLRYAEKVPMSDAEVERVSGAGKGTSPAGSNSSADGSADSGGAAVADSLAGISIVRREKRLRIVGIIETEPFGGMRNFARGRAFIPLALAEKLNTVQSSSLRDALGLASNDKTYFSLLVRVPSPSDVQRVQEAIKKMGFTTWSIHDVTRALRRFFAIFDLFLGIFGSPALAVASLGIINTLVMAILERRREIGIMKALGASDRDVKQLFFAEAGAMGLAGGAAGVALGWMIGRVINLGANLWLESQGSPPEQIWHTPLWLVGGALAFSVLVSLVAGIYPAARAARLDPVQALRYE